MLKKKRFLIGGAIIVLAIVYLGYTGFMGAATYYYTVSEAVGLGSSIYGENVQVNGEVAPGSLQQEFNGRTLKFNISEGTGTLSVVYRGVVPDTFKVGNEVVIEGYINSDGVFQANTIMTKCPSKYEPEQ